MNSKDEAWFGDKFAEINMRLEQIVKALDNLEIKADKSLNMARAISKKVLD